MIFYPSIVENVAHNARKRPEKLCLADEKKSLTYKEVWDCLCGLAIELDRRGVTGGSCVAVECDQSVDYMIFDFAIELLKGIFVPLEKNAAVSRMIEITTDTEAVLHVGPKPVPALGETIGHMDIGDACSYRLGAERDGVYCGSIEDLEVIDFPKAEDVAEILFSTGTTGKSKGVVLTHRNNTAIAENVCTGVKMGPDNVEMIPMPLSHSHGLRRTYANMANGSSVVLVDNIMFLKKVFGLMEEYGVTAMDLSPSMLTMIFKLSKDRLGRYADVMDYIQIGSAPLPEEDKEHISGLLPKTRLYNFYGSTEAGCSCLMDFNAAPGKKGCIGKPAVNAHFIVVDENKNEIRSSKDAPGFLASCGAVNMKEYFKAPELTKEAMPDGKYIYTKDLGYIDEDGFVYMLGRKDDIINFGGIKISPEEIERQVVRHHWIRDCACVPVDDPLAGQAPKLFVALESGCEPDAENGYNEKAFRDFLAKALDANKQPKYIEITDEIPRTFNGKIRRNRLTE